MLLGFLEHTGNGCLVKHSLGLKNRRETNSLLGLLRLQLLGLLEVAAHAYTCLLILLVLEDLGVVGIRWIG